MYSHFNPFASADAWWQHILMLVIAAVLGYIIGYISAKSKADSLRAELQALDIDIDECQQSQKGSRRGYSAGRKGGAVVAPLPAPVVVTTPNDLKVVEGIGPKIEKLLNQEGILTYAQLATTSPERIKEILVAAGPRYQMHNPATWPEQSALARDGQWDALKTWQDELNKGRTH